MQRPEIDPPVDSSDLEISAYLDEALSRLPARDSTALGMRFLQDKPIAEVAAAIGVSPNAAQKIVSRGLIKLRKLLVRRGVAAPTIAVVTTALLHESAKTAPAGIVISSTSSSSSSLSIAKGVVKAMFISKVKTTVAATAAAILLAGTGSFVAMRAMAQTQAPDMSPPRASSVQAPAPAPEPPVAGSVAPYDSPFLELVGCRIKKTLSLDLSADGGAPAEANWVEQQYPQVKWNIDPDLAAQVQSYSVSVTLRADPTGTQTIRADKSTEFVPLMHQMIFPGDYDVRVSALAANGTIVASDSAHIFIEPLPMTQIMIYDLAPAGGIDFTGVMQALNSQGQPITEFRFMNSDFVHLRNITDDSGRDIPFTTRHTGNNFQYRCSLNPPVEPGTAELVSYSGTMTGLVQQISPGMFTYNFNQNPNANVAVRRIELYRLPPGANLVYFSPNLAHDVVDGRVQLYMETLISPEGSNLVSFRYRLPPG
jgi:hypothetical protein